MTSEDDSGLPAQVPIDDSGAAMPSPLPLLQALSDLSAWRSLSTYPVSARLSADYAAGAVQIAIDVMEPTRATVIPVPTDATEPDPVNAAWRYLDAYSRIGGRDPKHAEFLRANPPRQVLLQGLWLIDKAAARELLCNRSAHSDYLYPADPDFWRRQHPGTFPPGAFFFCLDRWLPVTKERLLFRDAVPERSSSRDSALVDRVVLADAGKQAAILQHAERNRLYNKAVEEVRSLWEKGDLRLHSDMARAFHDREEYSNLSLGTLREKLADLARKMDKPNLIQGTKKKG